jgi:hypothetical protein
MSRSRSKYFSRPAHCEYSRTVALANVECVEPRLPAMEHEISELALPVLIEAHDLAVEDTDFARTSLKANARKPSHLSSKSQSGWEKGSFRSTGIGLNSLGTGTKRVNGSWAKTGRSPLRKRAPVAGLFIGCLYRYRFWPGFCWPPCWPLFWPPCC